MIAVKSYMREYFQIMIAMEIESDLPDHPTYLTREEIF